MPPLHGFKFTERYLKTFEEWSDTVAKHYAMVGLVASNWAYFEATIDDWTAKVALIDEDVAACLTAQIAGSARKLDAFISLLRLLNVKGPSPDEWDKFAKRAAGLAEQRNRAVHDPWILANPDNPRRLEITARRKLRNELVSMPTEDVAKLAANIENLAEEFEEIAMAIGWERLAASLKK